MNPPAMSADEPQAHGRPPFVASQEDLHQAEALAGYGMTNNSIAHVLGIPITTFQEHIEQFAGVLEKGRALAASRIGQSLYEKAVSGDLGAIVWWEKTRAGRTDRIDARVGGLPGAPPVVTQQVDETASPLHRVAIVLPKNGREAGSLLELDGSEH